MAEPGLRPGTLSFPWFSGHINQNDESGEEMANERRRFTAEFKREAVRLCQQPGASIPKIAEELGVDRTVLRRWGYAERTGGRDRPAPQVSGAGEGEVERLQRELKRVTMERDILKKALGYFAKDPQ
jgi:transposase